jgi:GntR family transcriptional regulator
MHKSPAGGEAGLFRDSPVPRYAQLADVFRQRIVRNLWPPGTRLPTLEALMREFNVARVTVRQAMELLARDGLVMRLRGDDEVRSVAPDGRAVDKLFRGSLGCHAS